MVAAILRNSAKHDSISCRVIWTQTAVREIRVIMDRRVIWTELCANYAGKPRRVERFGISLNVSFST